MSRDESIRQLRRLKLRLASRGRIGRLLVPFVEVGEFSLSHGFREVIARSRMRLSGQTTWPPPKPTYLPRRTDERPATLVIPEANRPVTTSIVIPVFNHAALTHDCLQSIIEKTPSGTYEVIAVDNGSDEHTQYMLSGVDGLQVIRNESNAGFVGACNQGAAAARGEFVLFLNNDTIVLRGWLEALLRTFEHGRFVGAVGAKLIYPNGRLQEAGGIIWSDGDGWNYGHNEDPEAPEYGYVREVDYCSGACLIVRRSIFEVLGGFDPRYAPAYYEDTDLAFRLREHGYCVLFQPAARVVHFGGATAGTDTSTGFKSFQVVNRQKFLERHGAALAEQVPHDPSQLRVARDRRRGSRILVMDHMVPHYDHDSGSVRMMALLRILVELGHRVTFLPDNLAGIEPYATELQQLGIEVLYGPSEFGYVERHGHEFDVAILCRALFARQYLPGLMSAKPRPFIIFDTVDLHHLREQRLAELEQDPGLLRSAERTRDVELGVMRGSNMVWVTSTYEAELLRRDPALPAIEIVPNIHTVRTDVPGFRTRRDILFIGGFRHAPNEDAVLYFVKDIWPLVKRALPDVRFVVVGSHTPPSVQRLASADVIVHGFVPEVEPVFDACRLSIAPLRYGAGVKGKITQSLAWGVPAVATPVAAEGMHLIDKEHVMIASSPSEFADRVIAVYRDESLWRRMSDDGRRHVQKHLSYEAVRTAVASILERCVRSDQRVQVS